MRHLLPVLFVIGSSFGIALAGAVGVLMITMGPCGMSGGMITTWFVYDIDTARLPTGKKVSPKDVVAVLDQRLAPRLLGRKGVAKVGDGNMIEVGLLDLTEKQALAELPRFTVTGRVEFRMLAQRQLNASKGRWIDVAPEADVFGEMGHAVVTQTRRDGDASIIQVLTIDDEMAPAKNVIESATIPSANRVRITFTKDGAPLMANWTNKYATMRQPMYLGLILDDKLVAGTPIHNPIDSAVDLTSRFEDADAAVRFVDILNAGPLPAPLKYSGPKKR